MWGKLVDEAKSTIGYEKIMASATKMMKVCLVNNFLLNSLRIMNKLI